MCSAQGFCSSKRLFYKAFYHFNASQNSLTHRDDGTYTPDEPRLFASLDAWCYAPCCAAHNARGAIFLGSLTSGACRLALRRLSGAGNNPMVGMTVAVAVAIEEASK